jgi:hypothetical protein
VSHDGERQGSERGPDVRVERQVSVALLVPLTERGRTWVEENADAPSWAWIGGALAVEPRMVGDLVEGMTAAGLEVEGPREESGGPVN